MNLFKKITLFSTIMAFCLIVLGAYVRLSDAGLGCPDWPGCFGTLTVPESQQAIEKAQHTFPEQVLENGKAWKEMIHRYVAGLLGLLILTIGYLAYKNRKSLKVSILVPGSLLGIVFFQAMLGMLTVTLLLKPIIVSAHLIGGMTTLAILTYMSYEHFNENSKIILKKNIIFYMARFGLILIFIQIFLGGWTSTNYAGLACTDYPTCHGQWIPDMDFKNGFNIFRNLGQTSEGAPISLNALEAIQWTHRIGAITVVFYFGYLSYTLMKYKQLRFEAMLLLTILAVQFIIGVGNLILHLPIALAVSHNLTAALLVVVITMINTKIKKQHA
ncbi:MAG: COX15/CtaA family protein [Methylophilaceae bacterium]|jgi:heme a synthase